MSGTSTEPLTQPSAATPGKERTRRLSARLRSPEGTLRFAGLAVVIAAAAVLNTVRLSQNGYGNIFYSAGVRSMLRSWHNFFFVASDPAGLVSIDKPPLGLWLQAASAELFGFHPLSVLLPEALAGVAVAAVLYVAVARRFGTLAGLTAGLVCAVFPSFVAVSRTNNVDAPLILLMLLACVAAIRACESGRWRTLLLSGVLVGLAFNTKTLAAYLAVPGIALAYLVCAPVPVRRRLAQLLVAGVVTGIVSFAWIAVVEATPASQRPYVGSSTDNTELGLTFNYNGFGRVEGQSGGPAGTHGKPGARVPIDVARHVDAQRAREHPHHPPPAPQPPAGRNFNAGRYPKPVPFGGPPGLFRLFGSGLDDQAGWLLPFAFVGLIAALVLLWFERRDPAPGPGGRDDRAAGETPGHATPEAAVTDTAAPRPWRRDPRLAAVIVLGGWFAIECIVLSLSKGIVHPYYASALAPGAGAMAGIGLYSLIRLCRRPPGLGRYAGLALAAAAVIGTVTAEIVIMHRFGYLHWFVPVLAVAAAACLVALLAATVLGRGRAASAAARGSDRPPARRARRLRLDDLARSRAVHVPGSGSEAVRRLGRRRAQRACPRDRPRAARLRARPRRHEALRADDGLGTDRGVVRAAGRERLRDGGLQRRRSGTGRAGPREAHRTRRGPLRGARRRVLHARRQRRDQGRARGVP